LQSKETKTNSEKEPPPIQVESLSKCFGSQKVLKGVSLELARGETLTVLGRSGTGKSVLLKLIIGLQRPDSGSIRVCGQDVSNLPLKELNKVRKKVGFLFQQAALYDSLTVKQNVEFPLRRHSNMTEGQRNKRVRELLDSVGMEEDGNKMPSEVSGGMQKRVGLARALALEPEILLFDEPTAGLDPITALEIDDLIVSLQKERHLSSIVVTHDIRAARSVSNRLALMRDGEILIAGTFKDLQESRDPFVVQFLGSA